MVGQSYGATLSLAMRSKSYINVSQHWLFNPMPFDPLQHVRNQKIGRLLQVMKSGHDMVDYMKSQQGREDLIEAARVFRIGSSGLHEIQHFNDRKLMLVEKAMERFLWIEKREAWEEWTHQLKRLPDQTIDRMYFSSDDSLFSAADYQSFASKIRPLKAVQIEHSGHMLLQDRWSQIVASS